MSGPPQVHPAAPRPARTWSWATGACAVALVVLPLLTFPLGWWPAGTGPRALTIPWAPLLAAATLAAAAWAIARHELSRRHRVVNWCLAALVASTLLSIRFGGHSHAAIAILPALVANLVLFGVASRLPVTAPLRLAWVALAAGVVVALNGLVRLGHEPEFLSTIGNRNVLGAWLAAAACLGIAAASLRAIPTAGRWLAALAVLPLLAALWFCESRGAWLGLAAGLATFGALFLSDRRLLVALALALGLALGLGSLPRARHYLARQWETDVRPVIWQATLHLAAAQPVVGHGPGSFLAVYPQYRLPAYFARPKAAPLTDHAHNEVLETAAEQGWLGAAVLVAVWATALWSAWKNARTLARTPGPGPAVLPLCRSEALRLCPTAALFLPATIVLLVHGLLDIGLRSPPLGPLAWLMLGLLFVPAPQDASPISVVDSDTQNIGGDRRPPRPCGPERDKDRSAPTNVGAWRPVVSTVACPEHGKSPSTSSPGLAADGRGRWTRPGSRWLLAAFAVASAGWLLWAGFIQPLRAGLSERQAERAARRGDWSQAMLAAREALDLDPFRLHLRYRLAGLLADLNTVAARHEAIKMLEALQQLAPDYANATHNLGLLYAADGAAGRAVACLERAIASNPYDPAARRALALARDRLAHPPLPVPPP